MNAMNLHNKLSNRINTRRGFSLIELVIVIVIIGIIAAIAIPRMSRGSQGAAESSLRANLAVMRNAIELFITEHEGVKPTVANFVTEMTGKTSVDGTVAGDTSKDIYGPYLREIPKLPVNGSSPSRKGANGVAAADGASVGWLYITTATTWELKPNTGTGTGQDGTAYNTW